MYQNRIRRTKPNCNPNGHPQFFIRGSEIALDERGPYIESVLAVLIESRFGPGSDYEFVLKSSDHPELDPTVFSPLADVGPNGSVPFYALTSQGRAGYQVFETAYRSAKEMALLDVRPTAHNSTAALTPNQGRGSP